MSSADTITPVRFEKDYAGSSEDDRRDLVRGMLQLARKGVSIDEAAAKGVEAGWRDEFVRWVYVKAKTEGEFTILPPLEDKVRVAEKGYLNVVARPKEALISFWILVVTAFYLWGSLFSMIIVFVGFVWWVVRYLFTYSDTSHGRWSK